MSNSNSAVVRIPKRLDEWLDRLAARTGKKKTWFAAKALEQFLEDQEDYLDAVEILSKPGKTYSLEEVRARLGLDGEVSGGSRRGAPKVAAADKAKDRRVSRKEADKSVRPARSRKAA